MGSVGMTAEEEEEEEVGGRITSSYTTTFLDPGPERQRETHEMYVHFATKCALCSNVTICKRGIIILATFLHTLCMHVMYKCIKNEHRGVYYLL